MVSFAPAIIPAVGVGGIDKERKHGVVEQVAAPVIHGAGYAADARGKQGVGDRNRVGIVYLGRQENAVVQYKLPIIVNPLRAEDGAIGYGQGV